ncbi:MAG TPA: ABC transporter permease [Candidatus Paceibacterota bacterium]|nr:ABC transporter permease [Candidatus Paceibacterota bacterium]
MYIESIPPAGKVFKAMFKADTTVLWRQRRAMLMTFLMPIVFVVSWKSLIPVVGAAGVLSICIAIGLPAVGLMSYPMSVARDRERGVFQRLRAAPIPTWTIMTSRILAQVFIVVIMTLVTYAAAVFADHITLPMGNVVLMVLAAAIGGISFLGLGQMVVGYVKSSESVNAVARLLYFPLAIVGALGEIGLFGQLIQKAVDWSPFGTTQTILAASMGGTDLSMTVGLAVLVTLGYGVLFAFAGIRRFQWSVN